MLSDSEYENMLREKLLKVEAEIALVDENIEALRGEERDMAVAAKKDRKEAGEATGK